MEKNISDKQEENKIKIKEEKIKEDITISSTPEEVNNFFKNFLNFKDNSIKVDGKMLFDLSEEDMKKLGMKLVQRKRLIKYLKKSKKQDDKENEEEKNDKNHNIKNIQYKKKRKNRKKKKEHEINITTYTTEEEVLEFLSKKYNCSEETIDELNLDGRALLELTYEDIAFLKIPKNDKDNLKK